LCGFGGFETVFYGFASCKDTIFPKCIGPEIFRWEYFEPWNCVCFQALSTWKQAKNLSKAYFLWFCEQKFQFGENFVAK
jgi:hypothetical protein